MDQIVEGLIYPHLKEQGYHIRKAHNREAWYIVNQTSGDIYVMLHNDLEWHVNDASGNYKEREELQKKVRELISNADTKGDSDSDSETGDKTNG
jgi:predicted Rdx family selenoprotein